MKYEITIHDRDTEVNKGCIVKADNNYAALVKAVEKTFGKKAFFQSDRALNQNAETRFHGQIFKHGGYNNGGCYGTALTGKIYIDSVQID